MGVEKKPAKATKFKGTKEAKATRGASPGAAPRALDFGALVTAIGQVHERCAIQAGKAVNITVTVRNWAIGCYIREYEQHGSDRAAYGARLLDSLAQRLASARIVGLASRTLRQCRQFYVTYPGMWQALSAKSQSGSPLPGFWQTLSAEMPMPTSITARALAKQRETPTPDSSVDPTRLVAHLSFSHFAELISIDDPLKRTFYELEAMRGNWSVRELQRQIGALYFERSGLSKNPTARNWYIRQVMEHGWSRNMLTLQIGARAHQRHGKAITNFKGTLPPDDSDMAAQVFKDPYLFDFLGTADPRREREVEQLWSITSSASCSNSAAASRSSAGRSSSHLRAATTSSTCSSTTSSCAATWSSS